jgi:hypothetical protein
VLLRYGRHNDSHVFALWRKELGLHASRGAVGLKGLENQLLGRKINKESDIRESVA